MTWIKEAIGTLLVALVFSGCVAVTTDDGIPSVEDSLANTRVCIYLEEHKPTCEELRRAYDKGLRAGKEIMAAEFRNRSELNQPNTWQPPMISEVDMPARIVNGMMIPAHRELVIVRPGYWVRANR